MGIFLKKKKGGFRDIIRCDEESYLIWKWHPNGTNVGETKREFAIRRNSILRVKDGEVAVFVYKQNRKVMQSYIVGPFDKKIKTKNLPVLSTLVGTLYESDTPFQAEIYFINLAEIVQVKFGVPFFEVADPRYPDFSVPVAVRGTLTFNIVDFESFIKKHRLISFNLDSFQAQIRDLVNRYVKDIVSNAPASNNISVLQIESKISNINDEVEIFIKDRLNESFGVNVTGFDIGTIEIDKTSENYAQLVSITKNITAKTIQANNNADIENYSELLRINREENQYLRHMRTRQENLEAYRTETQAEVGIAGANALGQMGANGAGDINVGSSCGFNPASIMTSMAVGGAVGQNVANILNDSLQGNQTVPPKIPTIKYNVVKNGKSTGPFDIEKLKQMASNGEILETDLVWTYGMKDWKKACEVNELKIIFPPKIPD